MTDASAVGKVAEGVAVAERSAVTARLKSGHDNKLAQIQEKKKRRNQKESEKASSMWLHLLAASARPRSPS